MNRIVSLVAAAAVAAGVLVLPVAVPDAALAQAGAAAFTYQGRLSDGSAGVDAPSARIRFTLWDAETGGSQLGSAWVSHPVVVTDGIFTTLVDFGSAAFDGDSRWLEIGVDVDGGTNYTLMQPRQRVTAAPMAVHALHGGDNPWTISGTTISYTGGNVGVGTGPFPTLFTVGRGLSSNILPMAHLRTTGTNATASLRFENAAGNHYNFGITAASDLALGYNANVPLGGDLLRITPSGNVGIGRLSPASKLDVDGTVRMTGFQLGESATSGYVLTTDASGIGTWQPVPTGGGGDCFWSAGTGGRIYYNDGNVGIGTDHPSMMLSVQRSAANSVGPMTLFRTTGANSVAAVRFQNALEDHFNLGITGAGHVALGLNANIGLAGDLLRITPEGNVGLGLISPAARLDVAGTVRMTGLQLGASATEGYVLTADADGVGTWQPAPEVGEELWSAGDGGQIYYNGGNVGIGTSTPGQRLTLGDTADNANYLRFNSAGYAGLLFYNSNADLAGRIVYEHSDDVMRFWANQVERMRITAGGNVGIGTTSPAARLHVNGTARMSGFQLGGSATAGHVLTAGADGVGTWQPAPETGETHWVAGEGGSIHFDGGNVGIGNTDPTYRLEVGDIEDNWTYLRLNAAEGSALLFNDSDAGYSHMGGIFYNHSSNTLNFHTGMSERMRISSEGNVGIGTGSSVPGQRLEVGNTNNYSNYIRVATHGTGNSGIRFWDGEGTHSGMLQYDHSDDSMRLITRSGQTAAERLRITSTGNVGIGTTAPAERLHVNGNVRANGTVHTDGFRLGTTATPGHVLTVNAVGVGTWQAPTGGGGFDLPYEGAVSSDTGPAFKITNNSAYGTFVAGLGDPYTAVSARTSGNEGAGVTANNDYWNSYAYLAHDKRGIIAATPQPDAPAAQLTNTGGGPAVKGLATYTMGGENSVGGWFESSSHAGAAVRAVGTGNSTNGLLATTSGNGGTSIAVYAKATGTYGRGVFAWTTNSSMPTIASVNDGGGELFQGSGVNGQVFSVANDGATTVSVLTITGGSDLAERFAVSTQAEPGMVVEIDPNDPGRLRVAEGPYNRRVAGVISGANGVNTGMVLSSLAGETDTQPVALSGRVWVYCDATDQAIEPGDMLTTSARPGHAMAVTDFNRAHGAVLGKAMSRLPQGETGMVLVLVTLQ